jgi:hypothetical protein
MEAIEKLELLFKIRKTLTESRFLAQKYKRIIIKKLCVD